MIGFSRATFLGRSGRQRCLLPGSYTGTQVSSPVTLGAAPVNVVANVLRDHWDTPGTDLTLRVYQRVGGVRGPLISQGEVSSGPTSHKGVAVPSPALPMIGSEFFKEGEFEIEVVTSAQMTYAAEFQG